MKLNLNYLKHHFWDILFILLFSLTFSGISLALEEGGYVGKNKTGNHFDTIVYNFLKHFDYDQFYWADKRIFVSNNDNYVDDMDIALYAGHGNKGIIEMSNSEIVRFQKAGSSTHLGYGDSDLEILAILSCKVVPAPIDDSKWWEIWIGNENTDVFDGVHQILGFRTNSKHSTDIDQANYFGQKVSQNRPVMASWFEAIQKYGHKSEFGSVVLYPKQSKDDQYHSFVSDPPYNHTSLYIWYQH